MFQLTLQEKGILKKALEDGERPDFFVLRGNRGQEAEIILGETQVFREASNAYFPYRDDPQVRLYVQIFDTVLPMPNECLQKFLIGPLYRQCIGRCQRTESGMTIGRYCPRCYLESKVNHLCPEISFVEWLIMLPSVIEEIAMDDINQQADMSFCSFVLEMVEHC